MVGESEPGGVKICRKIGRVPEGNFCFHGLPCSKCQSRNVPAVGCASGQERSRPALTWERQPTHRPPSCCAACLRDKIQGVSDKPITGSRSGHGLLAAPSPTHSRAARPRLRRDRRRRRDGGGGGQETTKPSSHPRCHVFWHLASQGCNVSVRCTHAVSNAPASGREPGLAPSALPRKRLQGSAGCQGPRPRTAVGTRDLCP